MIKLREIPMDEQAEIALIGSLIEDATVLPSIKEWISVEDFTSFEARRIFEIINTLYNRKESIDYILVNSQLTEKERNDPDKILYKYLNRCSDSICSPANTMYYAQRVHEKSIERKLCNLIQHGAMALEDDGLSVEEKIAEVASMAKLSQAFAKESDNQTVADMIRQLLVDLTGGGLKPISSGFNSLDHLIGGLYPGQLIIIAGPTSMGKTSLLMDIFIHTARIGQRPYYYSLEMLAAQISQRMVMNIARVPREQVDPTKDSIRETIMLTDNWPAWHEKTPLPNIDEIVIKVAAKKATLDIGIVFIDHLHKILAKGKNEIERLSYITNTLSLMACELKIPVVCAAQLNRETIRRDDHTPRLSDLRGCGSIENDARVVMILHRDDYYREQEEGAELDGMAQLYVLKSSEGKKGTVNLVWLPEFCSFSEASYLKYENQSQEDIPI